MVDTSSEDGSSRQWLQQSTILTVSRTKVSIRLSRSTGTDGSCEAKPALRLALADPEARLTIDLDGPPADGRRYMT